MKILHNHQESIYIILKQISTRYSHLKSFIDLGCGPGEKTIVFAEYDRSVTGIDKENYNTQHYKKFKFIKGDMLHTKFKNASFDMVYSYDVIEHLENPELLVKEMYRLISDKGIGIISTPNKYRLLNAPLVWSGIRKYPYCIDLRYKEKYPEYWHITEYSTGELNKIVEDHGLKIIEHYKIFYGFPQQDGLTTLFGLPFFHNHIVIIKKLAYV